MTPKYLIKREWNRLAAVVSEVLGRSIPEFDELDFQWDNATSRTAAVGPGPFGQVKLRLSKVNTPPVVTHDFTIVLAHEMCHVDLYNHGAKWKKDFRTVLDALGYVNHPVNTGSLAYVASDHPHLPVLPQFVPNPLRRGWMYFCECPGRTEKDGGYGIRSRRSLDGRQCRDCNALQVVWVPK